MSIQKMDTSMITEVIQTQQPASYKLNEHQEIFKNLIEEHNSNHWIAVKHTSKIGKNRKPIPFKHAKNKLNKKEFASIKNAKPTVSLLNNFASLNNDVDLSSGDESDVDTPIINALKKVPKKPEPITNMPPIIWVNDKKGNYIEAINKIKSFASGQVFFASVREGTSIRTHNKADFTNVKIGMSTAGMAHYTYTIKGEKPKNVLLKNIDHRIPANDIYDDLKLQGIEVIRVVNVQHRKKSQDQAQPRLLVPTDLFQVTLSNSCDVNNLVNTVRVVCHHKITWAPFVRSDVVTQCQRCQRFGHSSSNCKLDRKCVKCNLSHEYGRCAKLITDKPICVNCGGEHTANYRRCVKYTEHLNYITAKRGDQKNQTAPTTFSSSSGALKKGFSYASNFPNLSSHNNNNQQTTSRVIPVNLVPLPLPGRIPPRIPQFQNAEAESKSTKDNVPFDFISEIEKLFSVTLTEFMFLLKKFLPAYKSSNDNTHKQMLMISFLTNFV